VFIRFTQCITGAHITALEQDHLATWPPAQVVARLPGSLPGGGVVPGTPVHAFAAPPTQLTLSAANHKPVRTDIDLGGLLAFEITDVVSAQEADTIVAASEYFGYRDEAPGIHTPPGMRMNKSVHWLAEAPMMHTLCLSESARYCPRASRAWCCSRACQSA
jgi:hypothetical protein